MDALVSFPIRKDRTFSSAASKTLSNVIVSEQFSHTSPSLRDPSLPKPLALGDASTEFESPMDLILDATQLVRLERMQRELILVVLYSLGGDISDSRSLDGLEVDYVGRMAFCDRCA